MIRFLFPLLLLCAGQAAAAALPCPSDADAAAYLKRLSKGPLDFEADRSAAIGALVRREAMKASVFAAPPGPGPYGSTSHVAGLARFAPDARRLELFTRVAEDQFARSSYQVVQSRTLWAEDVSENAAAYLGQIVGSEACRADRENTAWLKADLKKNGWPRVSTSGADADHAAWLLVQHADTDPAFQAEVLAMLGTLLPAKETSRTNHAYLFDRVALAQGRKQRFATQGRCTGKGKWEPHAPEDLKAVGRLRKEAGLNPLADYRKTMVGFCP